MFQILRLNKFPCGFDFSEGLVFHPHPQQILTIVTILRKDKSGRPVQLQVIQISFWMTCNCKSKYLIAEGTACLGPQNFCNVLAIKVDGGSPNEINQQSLSPIQFKLNQCFLPVAIVQRLR